MIVEDDDWLDDDSDDADSCEASPMRLSASDDMAFDAQPMVAKRKIAALSLSILVRNLTSSNRDRPQVIGPKYRDRRCVGLKLGSNQIVPTRRK